jgi:ubiquinone/menaquinone biosynthesis C-methylase UbiE
MGFHETAAAWDMVAGAYDTSAVPLVEGFAEEALRLAAVPRGGRIVAVAGGPGTLAHLAARQGLRVSAIDYSPVMIARLRSHPGAPEVAAVVGDGMALPYADGSFVAGFSLFGVMLFPEPAGGLAELARVLRPGGSAVVTSWVAAERRPLRQAAYAILDELAPGTAPEQASTPSDREECRAVMVEGGFIDVEVSQLATSMEMPSTEAFVDYLARVHPPVAALRERLGDRWAEVRAERLTRLRAQVGPGPHSIPLVANLSVGRRPSPRR